MSKDTVLATVRALPLKPGVYLMRDAGGVVIYVGKAKSLRKRVSSYFYHKNFDSPRLRNLVDSIDDISAIRTETEAEALILEAKLIRKYSPFFNVDLKNSDRYPYIKIPREPFPRLIVTRKKEEDGAIYFGPYVSTREIRDLLRLSERYFPLRTCSGEIRPDPKRRPCIRYELGSCLAPCASLCDDSGYRDRVDDLILLLRGKCVDLVERIRGRMDSAANRLLFEEAARHRDAIRAIWKVSRQRISAPLEREFDSETWSTLVTLQKELRLKILPWRIDCFDISHFSGRETYGVVVVFEQGHPNPSLFRKFTVRTVEGIDDFRSIEEVVFRRYSHVQKGEEPPPQLVVIDGGKQQLEFALKALQKLGMTDLAVVALAKREEHVFYPDSEDPIVLSFDNPALRLLQRIRDEAHRYAIGTHRNKRDSRLRRSVLEEIPGIGRHRAAQLISEFGSVQRIACLDADAIVAKIPGMGQRTAERILDFLKENAYGVAKDA